MSASATQGGMHNKWSKNSDERPHRRKRPAVGTLVVRATGNGARRRAGKSRHYPVKNARVPVGDLNPLPSNTQFLWPTRVHIPNGISIGSAVFPRLRVVTNRQADIPRYSVCSNRPHLSSAARCSLIKYKKSLNMQSHTKITNH